MSHRCLFVRHRSGAQTAQVRFMFTGHLFIKHNTAATAVVATTILASARKVCFTGFLAADYL